MYDEMAIVVGKDVARGSCDKSFDDIAQAHEEAINLEDKGDGDSETIKENDKQSTSSVPLELRRGERGFAKMILIFRISLFKWERLLQLFR